MLNIMAVSTKSSASTASDAMTTVRVIAVTAFLEASHAVVEPLAAR